MAYDSKSVKVPKEVKRMAAQFTGSDRKAFIRNYVEVLESAARGRTLRNRVVEKGE